MIIHNFSAFFCVNIWNWIFPPLLVPQFYFRTNFYFRTKENLKRETSNPLFLSSPFKFKINFKTYFWQINYLTDWDKIHRMCINFFCHNDQISEGSQVTKVTSFQIVNVHWLTHYWPIKWFGWFEENLLFCCGIRLFELRICLLHRASCPVFAK